jgi:hypothetical protein
MGRQPIDGGAKPRSSLTKVNCREMELIAGAREASQPQTIEGQINEVSYMSPKAGDASARSLVMVDKTGDNGDPHCLCSGHRPGRIMKKYLTDCSRVKRNCFDCGPAPLSDQAVGNR